MCNMDIRTEIYSSGVRFWQVAQELNISPEHFSRKLRHELPEEKKDEIRSIIKELAKK